jgi:hypothetical protein
VWHARCGGESPILSPPGFRAGLSLFRIQLMSQVTGWWVPTSGSVLGRGEVAQRGVTAVVFGDPGGDLMACLRTGDEVVATQQLELQR